ncbi:feline leukemia virus subgroup C receptor-related protein 2-like [Colias croceus]|uniref:feline leukemia virus subgroup C receptor-related protein 2-like n=1 Tax=Colias crocea TaxID=72248 RepID=UPI001E27BCEA|nr:feline leukemia virus subgroup C receptor-related protein 2-like [Colias croceus]
MSVNNLQNGLHKGVDNPRILVTDEEEPKKYDVSGSVMDGLILDVNETTYTVFKTRWLMLGFFVLYSASNSLQWTQYTIISDIVVNYYGVSSNVVSWTSMVYMITYVPLIFPASWLLDKTNGRSPAACIYLLHAILIR